MSRRGIVDPVNDNGMCHAGKALSTGSERRMEVNLYVVASYISFDSPDVLWA